MSHKLQDTNWRVSDDDHNAASVHHAQLAVLMDIRREMKEANRHLQVLSSQIGCFRFTTIPATLKKIARNTAKKRKVKRA